METLHVFFEIKLSETKINKCCFRIYDGIVMDMINTDTGKSMTDAQKDVSLIKYNEIVSLCEKDKRFTKVKTTSDR